MFTGIVQEVGSVISIEGSIFLIEASSDLWSSLKLGSSISVDGACLTVTSLSRLGEFTVDVMPETVRRTAFEDLKAGSLVNLELPMAANGRFDGHIVQGHVDGVGVVKSVIEDGNSHVITIGIPDELTNYVVEKGSICIAGVSLTIMKILDDECVVGIIPHTWEHTTFGKFAAGTKVNIETDIVAKYIEKIYNPQ